MKKKPFIITVDTEPDGQWDINAESTTKNARFILRFQEACEKFGFKPVYLTDYIMASDNYFVDMIKEKLKNNKCEIGMHLHAWDTPPFSPKDKIVNARPFITEYSLEEMDRKIECITEKLQSVFNKKIITHRAGRWALNRQYIDLLDKYGYKVDCSVTPHVDWRNTKGNSKDSVGPDYRLCKNSPYMIEGTNILEVPMTIRKVKGLSSIKKLDKTSLKRVIKRAILGENLWLRPAITSLNDMKYLCNLAKDEPCLMLMLHSSELMPGGSPYFKDEIEIDNMYKCLEEIFRFVTKEYRGMTLEEYYIEYMNNMKMKKS